MTAHINIKNVSVSERNNWRLCETVGSPLMLIRSTDFIVARWMSIANKREISKLDHLVVPHIFENNACIACTLRAAVMRANGIVPLTVLDLYKMLVLIGEISSPVVTTYGESIKINLKNAESTALRFAYKLDLQ